MEIPALAGIFILDRTQTYISQPYPAMEKVGSTLGGFASQKRPIPRPRVRQPGTDPFRVPLRDLLLELD